MKKGTLVRRPTVTKATEKERHGVFARTTDLGCQKSSTPCYKADWGQTREGPALIPSVDSSTVLTENPHVPMFSIWINNTI